MSVGYDAAVGGAAVFRHDDRTGLVVVGRAPRQMLNGILTGTMPAPPAPTGKGVLGGVASYTAVLTPKGRMMTDARVLLWGSEESDGFLLDLPVAGRAGLSAHLGKILPPRMARVQELPGARAVFSVVGPEAAGLLATHAFGGAVGATELSGLPEGGWRSLAGGTRDDALLVIRWADVWPEAFDVLGPAAAVGRLRDALLAGGAEEASAQAWTTLRVEAGRPAFGIDMGADTIPVEAAIHERAIDYTKGCYTGQEVIVRIRDRGHVNRELKLLHLGEVEPPAPGTELFAEGSDRAAATVTSAVRSPRDGETLALAYVRRGVDVDALRSVR